MSEKFNGFSQDEINKVSGLGANRKTSGPTADAFKPALRGQHGGMRRMPEKLTKPVDIPKKQQVKRQVASSSSTTNVVTGKGKATVLGATTGADDDSMDVYDPDSCLSKSIEEALFYQPLKQAASKTANARNDDGKMISSVGNDSNDSSILKLSTMETDVSSTTVNHQDESSLLPSEKHNSKELTTQNSLNLDSPFKGISLKDFETHRKMIEEQNKQKKDLLYKAIEHHSQKTAAEARKIEEIKNELSKLDNDLAVDVAILRKQIDNACVHFSNVEKQYMKIEAQFLRAKIDLHNAAEKKELLTEHLCTVIAHNEDRKAQKLSELMEKVGLIPTEDEPTSTTSAVN